jgi:carboxymethylenebutenolidase
MTTLTATDGHRFDAYEAGTGPAGVIVVQEIFGVNPHIRSVADRFAAAGYRAIAPAFFDRVESGVELGYDADGMQAGVGFAMKLDWDNTMADLAATIDHLHATGTERVGVVGFCWGGTAAWIAASSQPIQAAVGYYGGGIISMIDRAPQVPTMLHFGALDAHIPLDGVAAVAAAHPGVPVHVYDEADHGFHCDARASYHPASAELAWTRTLEFFGEHL